MTIKLKILLFALVVVLVPFAVLGELAYSHSVRIDQVRYGQALRSLAELVAVQLHRRMQRLTADVQAFTAAPLLAQAIAGQGAARDQLATYFSALHSRFPNLKEFRLLDATGTALGGGTSRPSTSEGPPDTAVLAEDESGAPAVRVTVPVEDASAKPVGYLAVDVDLATFKPLLSDAAGMHLTLVAGDRRIVDADGALDPAQPLAVGPRQPAQGFQQALLYRSPDGGRVLGCRVAAPVAGLGVLAEMDADVVFAELQDLKRYILLVLALVLAVLLLAAQVFGSSLVRPLNRLIDGARRVAAGDLDVDLPAGRHDELGYLSRVFNGMVERLKEGRAQVAGAQAQLLEQNRRLEELTVTDALTGLANRRSLADNLERHLARFRRNGRPFCVLMLDLDHFKTVNDRHGHVVGDAVLCAFAATLAESVRSVDVVARYGGEEFTVILFETGRDEARESAERIRARVQEMRVEPEGGPALAVTVSIGIAEAGTADASAGDLLRRADQALYRAKRAGRNGVYFAEVRPEQPAPGGCGQGTRPSADSRRRS